MSDGAGDAVRRPPAPGSSYGPYTIIESLGAGGMGEVFRARDAKLNRHVALKFLPDELSSDEKLLARFQREAKLLALVSHPNIATIHSIEDDYDHTFLVLELIEGETLSNILEGGPLMLREALRVCRDIAAALESAHRKGIVHRDLKPANVIVTPDGIVKVLDFGIARPVAYTEAATDLEQTPSQELTATGTIIGTGPYMSPEQVRGKVAGRRADIWAFGCLMYQTLTGTPAFARDTLADTLTSILEREPDWNLLPAKTPESIRRLLRRCLQKDPSQRLQAIGDARIEIEETIREPADGGEQPRTDARLPRWQLGAGLAAAVLVGALIGAIAMLWGRGSEPPPSEMRWDLGSPQGVVLGLGGSPSFAVSRDGTRFVAALHDGISRKLYARELSSGNWAMIPGTDGAEGPFFSWSGDQVGYFAHSQLYRVPYDASELPDRLADTPEPYGGTWAADGKVYYSSNQTLWALPLDPRGDPEEIGRFDIERGELGLRWPTVLSDGVTLLYTGWVGPGSTDNILYMLRPGDEVSMLIGNAGYTRYSPPGYLIFARGTELMAASFDPDSPEAPGQERPLDVNVLMREDNGVPFFDVAQQAGTLVHAPGDVLTAGPVLAWMDATRESVPEPHVLAGFHESLRYPRLSVDGELTVTVERSASADDEVGRLAAVVFNLAQGSNAEELLPNAHTFSAEWSPTGDTLAFATLDAETGNGTVLIKAAHTTAAGTALVEHAGQPVPTGWSSTGTLFYNAMILDEAFEPAFDIWYVSTSDDTATPRLFLDDDYDNYGAAPSPDGDLVAYVRRSHGQDETEVIVTSFPHTDASRIHSVHPGTDCQEPAWSVGGDRLFYRCDTEMWAVEIENEPLRLGDRTRLWNWPFVLDDTWAKANYAYDPRRERFLMVSADPIIATLNLQVVLNWRPLGDANER